MRKVRIRGHWTGSRRCCLGHKLNPGGLNGVQWNGRWTHNICAMVDGRWWWHHHGQRAHIIRRRWWRWHHGTWSQWGCLCRMRLEDTLRVMHHERRRGWGTGHHHRRAHYGAGRWRRRWLGWTRRWRVFHAERLWATDFLLQNRMQIWQLVGMRGIIRLDADVSRLTRGLVLNCHSNRPCLTDWRLSGRLHRGRHQNCG